MAEVNVKVMEELKKLGVKTASFSHDGKLIAVEFFPSIAPLDLDTLVPPAPTDEEPVSIPPALARILEKGSVS